MTMGDVIPLLTSPDTGPNGQIRRDRWGRYLLPHPETGEEQAWTRVTTISTTLANRRALEQWKNRNIVWGLGQRPDLFAKAAAANLDDRHTLNHIVDEAEQAAAANAGANLGSAMHQFTERIDRGEQVTVPPPYDRDITAYQASMAVAGITITPSWVERIVAILGLSEPVAGTIDRLVNGMWPLPRVADVKTGKDVIHYGMQEIPLQLALYAHASHWWDGSSWHPMPLVDQELAVVIHLPVAQGVCRLYKVDIDAGWEAVQHAMWQRGWRARKDLAEQIPVFADGNRVPNAAAETDPGVAGPVDAPLPEPATPTNPTPGFEAQKEWVHDRVLAILNASYPDQGWETGALPPTKTDQSPAALLAELWPPDIPTFKQGGPTTSAGLEFIMQMVDNVETEYGLPFPPPDPTQPKTKKETKT